MFHGEDCITDAFTLRESLIRHDSMDAQIMLSHERSVGDELG